MAVSKKCKELLCLFYTGLLFVSGALLIICSCYWGYNLFYHFKFVPSECIAPFVLIFLLALLHILLCWLGIKGPTKEHLFHIVLFIIISVVLIAVEIAIGIWSMVLWSKIPNKSEQLMINSFQGFVKDNYDKSDWVQLQSTLQCCGVNNVSDYSELGSKSGSIPISCCNATTTACLTIFTQGCKEPLIQYAKKLMLDVALIGFGSGLFLVLGVITFYYFYKAVKLDVSTQAAARRASRTQEVNPLNRRSSKAGRASLNRQTSGVAA